MSFKLVEFSIENHKIFKEKVTFSMASRKDPKHTFHVSGQDLLRVSMIYGPNASGKSTLLKGLSWFREIVLKSTHGTNDDSLPHVGFKFSDTYSSPTIFTIAFFIEEKLYEYSFTYNSEKILHEILTLHKKTTEEILFLRNESGLEKIGKGYIETKSQEIFDDLTRKNALFLSSSAQWKNELSNKILKGIWNLSIISGIDNRDYRGVTGNYIEGDKKNEIIDYMQNADFCIENIETEYYESASGKKRKLINFTHPVFIDGLKQENNISLSFRSESDGTQQYFRLLGPIMDALENGTVLLIDEFDNSLHPLLTKHIVDLFANSETNPNNAQLIVTTHDTSLLDYKDEFIRAHFWFTEKNRFGEGKLFSLAEFKKNRNDTSFGDKYLEGRFGALPFIR